MGVPRVFLAVGEGHAAGAAAHARAARPLVGDAPPRRRGRRATRTRRWGGKVVAHRGAAARVQYSFSPGGRGGGTPPRWRGRAVARAAAPPPPAGRAPAAPPPPAWGGRDPCRHRCGHGRCRGHRRRGRRASGDGCGRRSSPRGDPGETRWLLRCRARRGRPDRMGLLCTRSAGGDCRRLGPHRRVVRLLPAREPGHPPQVHGQRRLRRDTLASVATGAQAHGARQGAPIGVLRA